MQNQEAVQGGLVISVPFTIPVSSTVSAARSTFLTLIKASLINTLTSQQLGNIIGAEITGRLATTGTPPGAPAARPDFVFGPGADGNAPDSQLVDYAGVGEGLDMKSCEWLAKYVPLSVGAAFTAVARVYLRFS